MDTIVKDTCAESPGSKHWLNIHPVSNASPYIISSVAPESWLRLRGIADSVAKSAFPIRKTIDTIVKDTCAESPGSKHWPNTHQVSNGSSYTII